MGQYRTELKQLESEMTKGRKIDEAVVVRDFLESLGKGQGETLPHAELASGTDSAMAPESATKDKPFVNSLGMKFVPVPISQPGVNRRNMLFGIWETRVMDYERFLEDNRDRTWTREEFLEDDHPVVGVTWGDAVAFCAWLTERERREGRIGTDERYRLPTDYEWKCAVGSEKEPWGEEWPPPDGSGNYYGEETKRNPVPEPRDPIKGYTDDFPRTAPVGSFPANQYGLHELGGNVQEWCEDWYQPEGQERRVIRGSSWIENRQTGPRNSHSARPPAEQYYHLGFRCVLAADSG